MAEEDHGVTERRGKALKPQGFRALLWQERKIPPRMRWDLVRGTGLEFEKKNFQQQITSNYVIFSSETIKHGISQSSCFIEDGPLKGQDKGQSRNA